MTPPVVTDAGALALREFHEFDSAGARFLYMVPSAGVFRLDDVTAAVLDRLKEGPGSADVP